MGFFLPMGLIDIVFFILYATVLNCVYFWPNIVFNPVEKFKKNLKSITVIIIKKTSTPPTYY